MFHSRGGSRSFSLNRACGPLRCHVRSGTRPRGRLLVRALILLCFISQLDGGARTPLVDLSGTSAVSQVGPSERLS
ncbi:hypothetical protein NDU88_003693 [Pleurodeles waltl]|uniref:Uncharacterized protein n=1 Tax=Pleurodeles waltl TaxID=8319 RepID=A0AAV7KW53_PLEWA|nr:hypothetical protein NDU88_003693 [Pleurodeles waltl]